METEHEIRPPLPGPLGRIAEVGVEAGDSADLRLRKETLVLASVMILGLATIWVVAFLLLGIPTAAAIPGAYQLFTVIGLAAFTRTKDFGSFRLVQIGLMTFLPFLLQWTLGGFVNASAVGLWGLTAALSAIFFYGAGRALPWFGLFLGLVVVSIVLEPFVVAQAPEIPEAFRTVFFGLNVIGVSVTAYVVLQFFVRQREAALEALDLEHRALRREQARSESLVQSILPRAIAERLKDGPLTIAEAYPSVTVVFADVVDFTSFAERTPPTEVVALLDKLFSRFDALADRLGLEKIKTIGDAYMVVAGLPEARPDHVEAAAEMALGMLIEAAECRAAGFGCRLRVGIDTGPAIAGVIGRQKFAYDLWGDTVNTASRMESTGIAGQIQVTRSVADALRERYVLESRGPVEIKGKGRLSTWLLVGRRDAVTAAAATATTAEAATATGAAGTSPST